ncbi:MAG: hypothetical protein RML56_04190 [Burkholderiales bacterium]|nr:hypothetical protein [Burkholderiales bacterium]
MRRRNSAAFADPRSRIVIEDAKSWFSAGRERYDLILSEPSNPWVSGVASLFTREFYARVRAHLSPGGILAQWFQLYEIDASLLASVMKALGEAFPHYAIYAASDHDLLILASERPLPRSASPALFEHPGLARELWRIHVLSAGDLDARYLGERATLEPLFASYATPANSDFYPVLDLNAARHRFTERSATGVVELLNAPLPVLELLEPARSRRPPNPLHEGAYAFQRIENTRLARYARDYLLAPVAPPPERIGSALQKDLELVKLRLLECRAPRDGDVWLHALLQVARQMNPFLAAEEARAVWARIQGSPCHAALFAFQRRWIALLAALGARDGASIAAQAETLLATQLDLSAESREFLLAAAMAGALAAGDPARARRHWALYAPRLPRAVRGEPLMRLLRCHAARGEGRDCAAVFAAEGG